jgi:hypothetical protein
MESFSAGCAICEYYSSSTRVQASSDASEKLGERAQATIGTALRPPAQRYNALLRDASEGERLVCSSAMLGSTFPTATGAARAEPGFASSVIAPELRSGCLDDDQITRLHFDAVSAGDIPVIRIYTL